MKPKSEENIQANTSVYGDDLSIYSSELLDVKLRQAQRAAEKGGFQLGSERDVMALSQIWWMAHIRLWPEWMLEQMPGFLQNTYKKVPSIRFILDNHAAVQGDFVSIVQRPQTEPDWEANDQVSLLKLAIAAYRRHPGCLDYGTRRSRGLWAVDDEVEVIFSHTSSYYKVSQEIWKGLIDVTRALSLLSHNGQPLFNGDQEIADYLRDRCDSVVLTMTVLLQTKVDGVFKKHFHSTSLYDFTLEH